MGFGINGHKCRDCEQVFNSMWNSVTMDFWDGTCPNCKGKNIDNLASPVHEWTGPISSYSLNQADKQPEK